MMPVTGLGFPPQNVARVVVWEWLNEHSRWRPYTATVCHHIENVLKEDARGSVVLGQVDTQLVPYIIDLQSMHQFRQDTGEQPHTTPPHPPGRPGRDRQGVRITSGLVEGSVKSLTGAWQPVGAQLRLNRCPTPDLRPQPGAGLPPPDRKSHGYLPLPPSPPSRGGLGRCRYVQKPNQSPRIFRCVGLKSSCGLFSPLRVPALPVKNLNGTGPVHPALAGEIQPQRGRRAGPTRRQPTCLPCGPPTRCVLAGKNPEDVVRRYMQKVKNPPDEDCTICMERLVTASGYEGVLRHKGVRPELVGRLGRCGHMYHLLCLVAMYSNGNKDGSLQCPTCKAIYGEKTGTQPPGKMRFHLIPHSLPGFADTQTIRIVYDIPTGIQGPEHPNPGKKFTARGFPRHCYLPNNEKGRKVLRLLITAWERRLIFTIGTSNTTGESDTVVWNEIHHKTEFGSNLTGHGYPDASYLDNVLAELTAQGVSEAAAKA
uniref:E3 ubiquitin-protein ligase n=1 Tax=Panthera tigris altaica TaxID=74533 RepID=A0A8C9K658_PANTA